MKKGKPGVCIMPSTPIKEEVIVSSEERSSISTRTYSYNSFIDYLHQAYDFEEVQLTESEKRVFKLNYEFSGNKTCRDVDVVGFRLVRNEKSEKIYTALFGEEDVKVYIEKSSGYFLTYSTELREELATTFSFS